MVFIEWRSILIIGLVLTFGASAVWLFIAVGKQKPLLRVPTRVVAMLIAILAFPLAALFMLFASCDKPSTSKFSPNGSLATRVIESDAGALGGDEAVELYWAHGVRNAIVFSGGWASTSIDDVKWIDDHHLIVNYHGDTDDMWSCRSAASVIVTCARTPWHTPEP